MKTLTKIFVILPLLFLGGCYTQMYFPVSQSRSNEYEQEDEYYEEDYDSTYNEEAYDDVAINNYYYDDYYSGYRRYLWGYHPSWGFSVRYSYYDPYWWDWNCCSPWYWGYRPYYYSSYWGYYDPYYYNYWGHYGGGYYAGTSKYRNTFTGLRNNSGERGMPGYRGNTRDGSSRNGGNSASVRDRGGRNTDVDLNKASVGRSAGSSSAVKANPNKDNSRSAVRDRTNRTNSGEKYTAPSSRNSSTPRSGDSSRKTGRSSSGSKQRESSSPSYNPPARSSSPSYSPPPSSSSGSRSSGSSSSSGRSSGSSSSSSSSGSGSSGRGR